MRITTEIRRPLGTMIVHGFARVDTQGDLAIARRIGAEVVEILPDWRFDPDPHSLRSMVEDSGLEVHSAHGCWGSQVIQARRVDLGSTDPQTWAESVDDLRRCVDWVRSAGGACLVVHPGGLSDPEEREGRRQALLRGLAALADHATGRGVTICVENMPPGVFPGSRMSELREVVDELDRVEVGLALDTGHAHISASVASETHSAGDRLRTTHVHDNNGRQDAHLPPGRGSIDWESWQAALDRINYRGPVVLECIRHLRDHPESLDGDFMDLMGRLCGKGR